jgi:hypothetical protein
MGDCSQKKPQNSNAFLRRFLSSEILSCFILGKNELKLCVEAWNATWAWLAYGTKVMTWVFQTDEAPR